MSGPRVERATNGVDHIVLLHVPGRTPVLIARGSHQLCFAVAEHAEAALDAARVVGTEIGMKLGAAGLVGVVS